MATLTTRLNDLATAIATKCKSLNTLINGNAADLSALTTTAKANLVAAINEVDAAIDALQAASGAQINDASTTSTTQTWSIDKIKVEMQAVKDALLGGAGAALDTLNELAAALGNDANFATTVTTALGKRLRFDAAQTLTAGEKTQGLANLGAQAAADIGFADDNFVATFTAGLTRPWSSVSMRSQWPCVTSSTPWPLWPGRVLGAT